MHDLHGLLITKVLWSDPSMLHYVTYEFIICLMKNKAHLFWDIHFLNFACDDNDLI